MENGISNGTVHVRYMTKGQIVVVIFGNEFILINKGVWI